MPDILNPPCPPRPPDGSATVRRVRTLMGAQRGYRCRDPFWGAMTLKPEKDAAHGEYR
ncbi:hypothetical protein J2S69_000332 [Glycomyces lechevalierae]|uniref:Uncharacterized protein n=1 Tax=Glycomyces lechevalierae TaxID=256034 RepID=A0ABU2AJ38_9ACTN|nr:hypothetical protein [Glycomyces lechevalierae]